ncbi:putative pentatricopeptide repeat-containing protein At3g49142 [Cryptomeria japonica]|uniref:putative pentatricopeptide repeat-containing protein At3g49142 n=1 Tax=Cryptomeria japonica TaxID=3369 RepID=UPI0027D9DFD5|nr:putative pentatricopeptide repeat-containing protein At3g49142 [Cryptomeria japonica]
MPGRDIISWCKLITGYAQNGFVEKALEVFREMQLTCVKPNSTTCASILPACAKMGGLEQGYAQNGFVEKALENSQANAIERCKARLRNLCSHPPSPRKNGGFGARICTEWVVEGCSQNIFLMKHSGTHPDHRSFTCVLFACSHAGEREENAANSCGTDIVDRHERERQGWGRTEKKNAERSGNRRRLG